jgi:predicted anti-sigma-YlaC factor YlaD
MAGDHLELHKSCARAREWVSLRLDGELSEIERLLVRRHLSRCEACRGFAEAVRYATEVLRETAHETPSRTLEPAEPATGRRRVRLRLAAVVAAVAVGAGVGSVIALSGGDAPPGGGTRTGPDIAQAPPGPPPPPGSGTTGEEDV